jgi:HTH-type transcriptional regulator, glycine betaine synthesis regulator
MSATNAKPLSALSRTRLEMIDACGRIGQVFGLPRSLGQIYGLLYLAPNPLSLDAIAELLGISKGSASTGTRQLAAWRGIRQVWVPGERRDHFEVEADLGNLLRSGFSDFLKPKLVSSQKRLQGLADTLHDDLTRGLVTREEYKVCAERLRKFALVQRKLQTLAPFAEKLF